MTGTMTPAARARRARSQAAAHTSAVMASSTSSRSKSRMTFFSRSPPAPFHNQTRIKGHQHA